MAPNERLAEFVGVMLGDGHIGIYNTKQGKTLYQLKVTLDSRNEQYTNYVVSLMSEILSIEPKIFFKKNENAVDIKVYNKEKVLFALEDIGLILSPKMNRAKIPPKFMAKNLIPFVLRGLFDTDGCVSHFNNNGQRYPRIEIRICPSPMQEQFIGIVKLLGFKYTLQNLEGGHVKIRISGREQLKKWFNEVGSSNLSYVKRAEPFLKRKV